MKNLPPIPDMIDPLGKAWDQPSKENIKFMFGHATMSQLSFDKLHEYSASNPTALYAGKMWKTIRKVKTKYGKIIEQAYLKYVTEDADPGYVNIRVIPIMIDK